MRRRRNLRKGDTVRVCRREYELVKSFGGVRGGGFQFRTWLAKERVSSRTNGGSRRHVVIKLTTKPKLATSELKTYVYLGKIKFPDRYYSELLAFDNKAKVTRRRGFVGHFYAILIKKYDGSLKQLRKNLSLIEREKLAEKIRRRIQALHKSGIVHGDLREANILIRRKRTGIGILLTDFANSKFVGDAREKENRKAIGKERERLDRLITMLKQD